MIKKELANRKVVTAISLGLATTLNMMTPMTVMAAEAQPAPQNGEAQTPTAEEQVSNDIKSIGTESEGTLGNTAAGVEEVKSDIEALVNNENGFEKTGEGTISAGVDAFDEEVDAAIKDIITGTGDNPKSLSDAYDDFQKASKDADEADRAENIASAGATDPVINAENASDEMNRIMNDVNVELSNIDVQIWGNQSESEIYALLNSARNKAATAKATFEEKQAAYEASLEAYAEVKKEIEEKQEAFLAASSEAQKNKNIIEADLMAASQDLQDAIAEAEALAQQVATAKNDADNALGDARKAREEAKSALETARSLRDAANGTVDEKRTARNEAKEAEEAQRTIRNEANAAVTSARSDRDAAMETETTLRNARDEAKKAVDAAREERDAAAVALNGSEDGTIKGAKAEAAAAKDAYDGAVIAESNVYDTLYGNEEKGIVGAQQAYDDAAAAEVVAKNTYHNAKWAYEGNSEDGYSVRMYGPIKGAEQEQKEAEAEVSEAQEVYNTAETAYKEAEEKYKAAKTALDNAPAEDSEREQAIQNYIAIDNGSMGENNNRLGKALLEYYFTYVCEESQGYSVVKIGDLKLQGGKTADFTVTMKDKDGNEHKFTGTISNAKGDISLTDKDGTYSSSDLKDDEGKYASADYSALEEAAEAARIAYEGKDGNGGTKAAFEQAKTDLEEKQALAADAAKKTVQAYEEYTDCKHEYKDATATTAAKKTALETAKTDLETATSNKKAAAAILETKNEALENAKSVYNEKQSNLTEAKNKYTEAQGNLETAKDFTATKQDALNTAKQTAADAEALLTQLKDATAMAQKELEEAKTAAAEAQQTVDNDKEILATAEANKDIEKTKVALYSELVTSLNEAQQRVIDANNKVTSLQKKIEDLEVPTFDSEDGSAKYQKFVLDSLEEQLKEAQKEFDAAKKQYEGIDSKVEQLAKDADWRIGVLRAAAEEETSSGTEVALGVANGTIQQTVAMNIQTPANGVLVANRNRATAAEVIDAVERADEEADEEVASVNAAETPVEDNKQVVEVEDNKTPLAATAPEEEQTGLAWLWSLIVTALGGTGFVVFRKSQKKATSESKM